MLRDLLTAAAIASLLLAAGLYAWMSRQPDHPVFARASEWPRVGPLVTRLRDGLAPAPPDRAPGGEALVGEALVGEAEVAITAHAAEPPAPERRRPRIRVRPRPDGTPPLGNDPEPARPLVSRPPTPERLEQARSLLRTPVHELRIGPYRLLTDVPPSEGVAARLEIPLLGIEDRYARRYGVEPVGRPREAVVLFANERDYRRYQKLDDELAGARAAGHSSAGIVALYAENRLPIEVVATFVHEIAHLLNRRAVGPALPPWLEEGLADDFALLSQGPWSRYRFFLSDSSVALRGPLAGLSLLAEGVHTGTLRSLEELLAFDAGQFLRAEDGSLLYAHSAFLVHFLLRDETPERADRFRRFLREVAAGGRASGRELEEALGERLSLVDSELRLWLVERAELEEV